MKDFILDLTYKDATIINSNDDIFTVPINYLPNINISHHTINLNVKNSNNKEINDKFNHYNSIDCL